MMRFVFDREESDKLVKTRDVDTYLLQKFLTRCQDRPIACDVT
jgi:hypothetical protein